MQYNHVNKSEVWMKAQQAPIVNDQQDFFVNFYLRLVGPKGIRCKVIPKYLTDNNIFLLD